MTDHPSDSQPFRPGADVDLPLFTTHSINPSSFCPLNEPFLQTDNCNQDILTNPDINTRFLTVHPSRNDSLSDDSHFEQTVIGSNENSIQPSPSKLNVTSRVSNQTPISPSRLYSNPILISNPKGSTILPPKYHPQLPSHTSVKTSTEDEIDISSFIDNFLGSDELMQNVPPVTYTPPATFNKDANSLPPAPFLTDGTPSNSITFPQPLLDQSITPSTPTNSSFAFNLTGTVLNRPCIEKSNPPLHPPRNIPPTTVPPTPPPNRTQTIPAPPPARRSEKRKPRTYSQAVPSQHCHICSRRPTEGSPHQVCGNLQYGRCRKTICTKCFHQFRWDLEAARAAPPGAWKCPHCLGQCPQRAQCVIYNRTSDRRRLKLINHRKRKREEEGVKGGGAEGKGVKTEDGNDRKRQAGSRSGSPDSGKTETGGSSAGASSVGAEAKNVRQVRGGAGAAVKQTGDQGCGSAKGKKGVGGMKGRKKGGKKGKGGVKEEAAHEVDGVESGSAVPLSVWGEEGMGGVLGYGRNEEWMNGGGGSRDGRCGGAGLLMQSIGTEERGDGGGGVEQGMARQTQRVGLEIEIEGLGNGVMGDGEKSDVFGRGFEGNFGQSVEPLSIGKELGTICGIDEAGLVSVGQGSGQVEERGFVGGAIDIEEGESIGIEQLWPRGEEEEEEEEGGSGGIEKRRGGELWMFAGEEEDGRDELLGVLGGGM